MFKGVRSILEIIIWRDKLQEKVDKISVDYFLPFICEAWNPGGRQLRNKFKNVSMVKYQSFLFLDL